MLMDLLHGFEVLSTTEETLFNSRNVSRLVQNNSFQLCKFTLTIKGIKLQKCQSAKYFGIILNENLT